MSIEVRNLRKRFGGAPAVAGIDLTVRDGQMVVLLGPSGCGKSTTMRCVAGLETPDNGTISIKGQVVFDPASDINVPVNRRHVGMVFQSYAIWPHMTVFENVAFGLEMERAPREEIRARVDEILSLVGLKNFAGRGASYLSGGQMQRVALARSLVMRPSVLLFDEPLSNLDARLRDNLRVQIRELQTQFNISAIYVTHDQREALALADDIVVMQDGNVLQTGDPLALYNKPKTRTVAEFLGYSNIFDVDELVTHDALSLVRLKGANRPMRVAHAPRMQPAMLAACIRPDDVAIELASGGDDPAFENALKGVVILSSFLGLHMQYRVRSEEGDIWDVLSPDISAAIKLGASVNLRVNPQHMHLLPKQ